MIGKGSNRMRVINYQPSYPTDSQVPQRGNAEQLKIPVGLEINIKRMQKDRTTCAVPRLFLLALGPRIVTPPPGYAYGNSVHLAHADERKADEHGHPAAGGRLGGRLP